MGETKEMNMNEFYNEHKQQQQQAPGLELQRYRMHKADDVESQSNSTDEKGRIWLEKFQSAAVTYVSENKKLVKHTLLGVFSLGYLAYFVTAVVLDFNRAIPLVVLTASGLVLFVYYRVKALWGDTIQSRIILPLRRSTFASILLRWFVVPALIIGYIAYLSFVVIQSTSQVRPIVLLFFLLLIPLLTCKHPRHIRWRPVLWGLGTQFALGLAVLRWKPGYTAIKFVTDQLNTFLGYSFAGAGLVFGDPFFFLHPFAMMVVPMVIFIGAVMSMASHFNVTQTVMAKFGWFMSVTFHTTGVESASLIANIFLSPLDIAVLLEPFTPLLTKSEFHTMVVGCHASIAGFAYAIFVWFGNSAQHLITAALMSAPAAVAIAKLNYPETEITKFKAEEDFHIATNKKEKHVVEAAIKGAFQAAKASTALMIEILACYSLYVFLNATVGWIMSRVSIEGDLETIFAYMFMPLVYMMGIDWSEAHVAGRIMGIKLLPNEMLAYMELGTLRVQDKLSEKAVAITTYAICGFSSLGTFAIFVGIWAVLSKGKVKNMATMLVRCYINTNIACFITACVAGMLYDEEVLLSLDSTPKPTWSVMTVLGILPGYEQLIPLLPGW